MFTTAYFRSCRWLVWLVCQDRVKISQLPLWSSQGSMVGPLCSLSTHRQLSASLHPTEYRNVHYVQYTDDTQCLNYTSLSALTRHSALSTTVSSPSIAGWTPINGLCLNPDKTEAIVTGTTSRQRSEPQVDDVTCYCSCYNNSKVDNTWSRRQRKVSKVK